MMGLKSRDDFLPPFFAVCCDEPVAGMPGQIIFYHGRDRARIISRCRLCRFIMLYPLAGLKGYENA